MVYDIEFVRDVDGNAALTIDATQLVSENVDSVVIEAQKLLLGLDSVPPPNGFRIYQAGILVHSFHEFGEVNGA